MAAALFESLIMIHPFVDGNKRVAFFATDVFLRMNSYKLKVDSKKRTGCLLDCWKRIAAISTSCCRGYENRR